MNEITRVLISEATRSKRFRPRAVRIDSTVIEADVKYPTDSSLAAHGVKVLAREGRKLASLVKEKKRRVRDRSRSMGRTLRAVTRTIRRRSGEAKAEVLKLTAHSGELLAQSIAEPKRLVVIARRRARGRGATAKLQAAARLEELADRCEKVASQIKQRVAGEPITDRLVSISDPDARPIRKGKLGKPNELRVRQPALRGDGEHPAWRAWTDPAAGEPGRNPGEDTLLPDTIKKPKRLGISPKEVPIDGGFNVGPTREALEAPSTDRVSISGRQQPRLQTHPTTIQKYRTGAEGRISHLKRGYGMDRSRLKGDEGQQIWNGWAILTYNADTLAIRER